MTQSDVDFLLKYAGDVYAGDASNVFTPAFLKEMLQDAAADAAERGRQRRSKIRSRCRSDNQFSQVSAAQDLIQQLNALAKSGFYPTLMSDF